MAARHSPHTMNHRLLTAVSTGDADLLAQILGVWSRATAEEEGYESILRGVTVEGSSVLHIAASRGYLELAVMIHTHDSSLIRARNNQLDTPLICAARAGCVDVVDYLMMNALAVQEAGYPVLRAWNSSGATAMHEAVRNGHVHVVQKLMSRDSWLATVVDGKGLSPLYLAIVSNRADMVEILIKGSCYGVRSPASYAGPDGKTALHAAVYANRAEEMCRSLLNWEPSLGKKTDSSGRTALHYAASAGKVGVVKLLLGNSSLGYIPDNDGLFPIHAAAIAGNSKVVRVFMEICPSSDELLDHKQRNVLHCAVEHASVNVVWHILRNPAFVRMMNVMDGEGNTPLHLAVKHGHVRIFSLLTMDSKLSLSILNHRGLTPLDVAWNEAFRNYSFSTVKNVYIFVCLKSCEAYASTFRDLTDNLYLEDKENESNIYTNVSQSILYISVLIAAGSFTAVFTPPGGYNAEGVDAGKPVLGDQDELLEYISSNAYSFFLSTLATCLLVHASLTNIHMRIRRKNLYLSAVLVYLAVFYMLDTFMTVVMLTLEPEKYSDHYNFYVIIRFARGAMWLGIPLAFSFVAAQVCVRVSRQLWTSKQMFQDMLKVPAGSVLIISLVIIACISAAVSLIQDLYDYMQDDSEYLYPT